MVLTVLAVIYLLLTLSVEGFSLSTSPSSRRRGEGDGNSFTSPKSRLLSNLEATKQDGLFGDTRTDPKALVKNPVILCPSQFGAPPDYGDLLQELNARGFPAYVADLGRSDWFELIPHSFTADYWKGTLQPSKVLRFYYRAIQRTVDLVAEQHPNQQIHLVGHSIGGWVARLFLAEEADEDTQKRIRSLTTLGSPNKALPEDAPLAIDQTRGLLSYVNSKYPGATCEGVRYFSAGGSRVRGQVEVPPDFESALAFLSYFALCGKGGEAGDGIVPYSVAELEGGERHLDLGDVKHTGFLPWFGPGTIQIPGLRWYGTPEVVDLWSDVLD
uniref:GPI inositol-deacylase n=1 Tax=Chromera velia CCMP2878 TaxID=1169474 RepID=A0A0G4HP68_9ALVE|mmetsp:Transcript_11132/g.21505  ORF Transcript_11132/g.21505 Transcript_11132/m.21505 type:complete len:328 (+) Transcript_11132:170-1153(+)|eukprot:Cvel_29851.t1-p1 / transcript=Cvel_29851.t1 / gene=Cvel_29851 / organism=Chromera_velia_CCMP2878 / gene_product=hypothetical protein / transcript_product=hypothetical protein / location=Cvel_scaffold4163:1846-4117(-) / protein_length=327 / sequence_SO=supercontig / SO=protein_coding / is_pseudo=false